MILFSLLIAFKFKHFICDFLLQNEYMLGKFKEKGWAKPLAAHCLVHAIATFLISFTFLFQAYNYSLNYYGIPLFLMLAIIYCLPLALTDFAIHFIMDRIKASPKLLGRFVALSKFEYERLLSSGNVWHGGYKDMTLVPIPSCTPEFDEKRKQKLKSNKYFWISLGADQLVHSLTDLLIVFMLIGGLN